MYFKIKKLNFCKIHNSTTAAHADSDLLSGLRPYLCLARGARVMITSNLWIDRGLVNGATGTLRHFIFEQNAQPPQLPIAIVVEMDAEYKGPHLNQKHR